jgi:uncharacterized protein YecE (DUF72 family)
MSLQKSLFESGHDDADGQPGVRSAAQSTTPLALPQPLPDGLFLGTSSWSFPGWAGLVYDGQFGESRLARDGLKQYSRHDLLRCVGIDRGFYAPLAAHQYAAYAAQVHERFRFLVKAPSAVCDAQLRSESGKPDAFNPGFLDPVLAADQFVGPCLEGLGGKAGPLVFQLSPLPASLLADPPALIERLGAFFAALPEPRAPAFYALEIRDARLLTPRLAKMLDAVDVRLCLGIHARMPDAQRQAAALALMQPGPLVVRWSLHAGLKYEGAKERYFPFKNLVDPDPATRGVLAQLAIANIAAGQPVYVIVNNKAEGSAPLSVLELALQVLAGPFGVANASPVKDCQ